MLESNSATYSSTELCSPLIGEAFNRCSVNSVPDGSAYGSTHWPAHWPAYRSAYGSAYGSTHRPTHRSAYRATNGSTHR